MFRTKIHTDQFIVASISPDGKWSISQRPKIHTDYQEALAESKRLSRLNRGYKFVALAVSAVAFVKPVNDPVEVTYRV